MHYHFLFSSSINTRYSTIISTTFTAMPEQEACLPDNLEWPEPDLPYSDTIQELHAVIEKDWDSLRQSACQTAAGRALWKHVIHDPLAELLAGETYLKSLYEKIKKDRINNAKEISGVILAVRTLWFDNNLEAAVNTFGGAAQVVLLGAGWSPFFLSF